MRFLDDPHHDGSALYVSTQTPELGARATVRVRAPRGAGGNLYNSSDRDALAGAGPALFVWRPGH